MNKILLIDKPVNWTSFDVVAKVRTSLQQSKTRDQEDLTPQTQGQALSSGCRKLRVGHTGTLDPFATGLLIVLVGDATKKQAEFMKLDKEYEATLRLGYTSTTGDPEGTVTPYVIPTEVEESLKGISRQARNDRSKMLNEIQIDKALKKFEGKIEQTPHRYSAIKIKGKKAYELARKGEEFELKPRAINIYQLGVIKYEFPELHLKIRCSSGTYIRTLAEDIGKALGAGAYLTALRRTKIGEYDVKDAKSINEAI